MTPFPQIFASSVQTLASHMDWLRRVAQIFEGCEIIYKTDLYPYYMQFTHIMPEVEVTEENHHILLSAASLMKTLIKAMVIGILRILGTGNRAEDNTMCMCLRHVLLSRKVKDIVLALTLAAGYVQTRGPVENDTIGGHLE